MALHHRIDIDASACWALRKLHVRRRFARQPRSGACGPNGPDQASFRLCRWYPTHQRRFDCLRLVRNCRQHHACGRSPSDSLWCDRRIHVDAENTATTLDTLAVAPFNKLRMTVGPTSARPAVQSLFLFSSPLSLPLSLSPSLRPSVPPSLPPSLAHVAGLAAERS